MGGWVPRLLLTELMAYASSTHSKYMPEFGPKLCIQFIFSNPKNVVIILRGHQTYNCNWEAFLELQAGHICLVKIRNQTGNYMRRRTAR